MNNTTYARRNVKPVKLKALGRNERVTQPYTVEAIKLYQEYMKPGESIEIEGPNFRYAYPRNELNNTSEKAFYATCRFGNKFKEWRVDYQFKDDSYRISRQEEEIAP